MGLLLYDNPLSSNALKVRFLLAELGLPHRRETVSLARPRPDSYLALNPLGGIPALDDDGFVLAESHAILRYLADREGRDDLYPAAARERARVEEFLDRWATGLRAAFFRHERAAFGYVPGVGFGAAEPDHAEAARIAGEIAPQLALADALVDPAGAVLGRFTIADCAVAPVLFRTTLSGLSLDAHPRLAGLRERLLARPAFAAADPVR
ncbi:MAG: glutathione S-transferase family protein [Thermoleophilia bacterium]